jgi:hypothetical protein
MILNYVVIDNLANTQRLRGEETARVKLQQNVLGEYDYANAALNSYWLPSGSCGVSTRLEAEIICTLPSFSIIIFRWFRKGLHALKSVDCG